MKKNQFCTFMLIYSIFLLTRIELPCVRNVHTVGHVAVEVGDTVHIPCKYEDKYKNNVKYLCRGSTWGSCRYEIKTNQRNSAKYSISDDKNLRIVTFTIKNLQFDDSNDYWCTIEKSGPDDGKRFQVSKSTCVWIVLMSSPMSMLYQCLFLNVTLQC
uniref:Immunoglobulin domain-containing protein n=1 Tax=Neogobius melanostomus TaxID=47308 RepID=A0A8C6TSH3_9GOBI